MTKQEYRTKVNEIINAIVTQSQVENLSNELRTRGIKNPFIYGAWCERNFEANLREDYKRKTTFTSDFSIAEWCTSTHHPIAVADTLKRALNSWRDSYEYLAELVIVLNLKSWEHYSRKNQKWSELYSDLYYKVKDLYFDHFGNDSAAVNYYYNYVD